MNVWDNIKAAQIAHNIIHQKTLNSSISDFNSSCIICAKDSKQRTRNYKNFLIYLTNHYQLTDVTDETNLILEKFSKKLEILIQKNEEDNNRETAKSVRKDAESIFETVRLSRIPKTSFTDTVFIIIEVAYRTGYLKMLTI